MGEISNITHNSLYCFSPNWMELKWMQIALIQKDVWSKFHYRFTSMNCEVGWNRKWGWRGKERQPMSERWEYVVLAGTVSVTALKALWLKHCLCKKTDGASKFKNGGQHEAVKTCDLSFGQSRLQRGWKRNANSRPQLEPFGGPTSHQRGTLLKHHSTSRQLPGSVKLYIFNWAI